jgi:hypothetical protein
MNHAQKYMLSLLSCSVFKNSISQNKLQMDGWLLVHCSSETPMLHPSKQKTYFLSRSYKTSIPLTLVYKGT